MIWETGDRPNLVHLPLGRWEKGPNFVGDLWEMGDGSMVVGDGRSSHIPLVRLKIKYKIDGKWNMVSVVCNKT